jgi:hypothetical protein
MISVKSAMALSCSRITPLSLSIEVSAYISGQIRGRHLPPTLTLHIAIRDFLMREDSKIWEWFASNKAKSQHADAVRFDLLKKTYRVEPAADPERKLHSFQRHYQRFQRRRRLLQELPTLRGGRFRRTQ